MMKTITYAIPQLPTSWVVRCSEGLFIVPAIHNGWRMRKPYRGLDPDKIPTAQVTSFTIGTNIPSEA
jgi:hypothetical protein